MMSQAPVIEVSAFGPDAGSTLLAQAGPVEAWDFDSLLQEVLKECAQKASTSMTDEGIRLVCTGRFSGSTPGFGMGRLILGQLVALNGCIELHLDQQDRAKSDLTDPGQTPRLEVHFTLETHGDYDPRDISLVTGLEPSRQVRKGDIQPINGQPSASTRWTIATPERSADSFDALLDEILGILESRAQAISSLTTHELVGVLSLVGYFAGAAPLVRFRVDQLRLARRLGLEIDVDLIPSSPTYD